MCELRIQNSCSRIQNSEFLILNFAVHSLEPGEILSMRRDTLSSSSSQDRRGARVRARRLRVSKFQSWQRWTPSQIVPLVRLLRLLTH